MCFKRKWYAGETISVAIGQGADLVTPLQLAHTIGGVASGGVFHRPHVVLSVTSCVRWATILRMLPPATFP